MGNDHPHIEKSRRKNRNSGKIWNNLSASTIFLLQDEMHKETLDVNRLKMCSQLPSNLNISTATPTSTVELRCRFSWKSGLIVEAIYLLCIVKLTIFYAVSVWTIKKVNPAIDYEIWPEERRIITNHRETKLESIVFLYACKKLILVYDVRLH